MRTGTLLLLLGLLLSAGVQAQQTKISEGGKKAPVNTLSAQQIAQGWIQLFDGTTDYGWKPRGDAKWTVVDGALVSEPGAPGAFCTTTEFSDGELHFECAPGAVGQAGIALRAPADAATVPANAVSIYIGHDASTRGSTPYVKSKGWTSCDLIENGNKVELRVNGISWVKSVAARGYIALLTDGKDSVQFRNIRFRPAGLKTVFNGKDLTGWTSPEGNKSVFSVTKEGWLNVKNGRGDLQTIEQWGDFVLQIDVYSNGDHLNSGVFFRAEPGKFQQGYEDQIRNQWEGDDRTRPVDYGTGAIYNRLPVRKVVSSDREWFTMTLVAHGTHMGSWVNGVQVCDFTDTRPPDQVNARKGARTKAGVISLQGHDPTTDLNFRNIRIVELPPVGK